MADALRSLTDDELTRLLLLRPDLAAPPPASLGDLANRACAPYSLQTCLVQLDQFGRQLLEALVYLGHPATAAEVAALAADPPPLAELEAGLQRLRVQALALRHPPDGPGGTGRSRWAPIAPLLRAISRPFALGQPIAACLAQASAFQVQLVAARLGVARSAPRPRMVEAIAAAMADLDTVEDLLDELDTDQARVLEGLVAGGGLARVDGTGDDEDDLGGNPPAFRGLLAGLTERGLIVGRGWDLVEVPREVGLALRGGSPLQAFRTAPPPVEAAVPGRVRPGEEREPPTELTPPRTVEHVTRLLRAWGDKPATALVAGGVAAKDVKAAAKLLGVPERDAARLVDLAGAAGLVLEDSTASHVAPAAAADEWLALAPSARWLELVRAWAVCGHDPSEAGSRDEGGKLVPPLAVAYPSPDAPWRRARVLAALAAAPAGGPPDLASLTRHALWWSPGRWASTGRTDREPVTVAADVLDEAALLGLTRGGVLTDVARAVLFGPPDGREDAAASAFPASIHTFTVGADLTAVAPAELDPDVLTELEVLAAVESRGGATVFRFAERSLGRAFDLGRTAEDVLAFLEAHARPAVPQPLRYLVDDVARRHGNLRVAGVHAYVRSDDAALLAEVVRAKKAAKARLRLVAPTVAVSSQPPGTVVGALRDAGYLPAVEDDTGAVVVQKAAPTRARQRWQRPRRDDSVAEAAWRAVADELGDGAAPGAVTADAPAPVRALVARLRRT